MYSLMMNSIRQSHTIVGRKDSLNALSGSPTLSMTCVAGRECWRVRMLHFERNNARIDAPFITLRAETVTSSLSG